MPELMSLTTGVSAFVYRLHALDLTPEDEEMSLAEIDAMLNNENASDSKVDADSESESESEGESDSDSDSEGG